MWTIRPCTSGCSVLPTGVTTPTVGPPSVDRVSCPSSSRRVSRRTATTRATASGGPISTSGPRGPSSPDERGDLWGPGPTTGGTDVPGSVREGRRPTSPPTGPVTPPEGAFGGSWTQLRPPVSCGAPSSGSTTYPPPSSGPHSSPALPSPRGPPCSHEGKAPPACGFETLEGRFLFCLGTSPLP